MAKECRVKDVGDLKEVIILDKGVDKTQKGGIQMGRQMD